MRTAQDRIALHNGYKIPCVGFGTFKIPNGPETIQAVLLALNAGYRHIDTAAYYKNEQSVGEALRESGIPREDIFVTSKVWNTERTYDKVLAAFDTTLENLELEYLDLFLVHWPAAPGTTKNWKEVNIDVWRAMEKLYAEGRVKAIGVSNFKSHHLEALMEECEIVPMVNQIECHPGYPQWDTLEFCNEHDILVEAWSPLGRGRLYEDQTLKSIAATYGCSVAQLCIRWCLQNQVVPLPKSVHADYIEENARVFDFTIRDEDMRTIAELPEMGWSGHDSDKVPF